jgi:hypothetical protein
VNLKLKKSNLIYRKLKISDYYEFKKLFYFCFNRKVSFDFFKWRYFGNKFSFCYGAFEETRLIANVGMISMRINNNSRERIFSRHSSMVLKKYRGQGIFSNLLKRVKKKISKNVRIIVMWPNKNNHANFGIESQKLIKKKYYLYKTSSIPTLLKRTKNYHIDELVKFKSFIGSGNSFFLKNFMYLKKRYLSYQKQDYLINGFKLKKLSSYFILKLNKEKSGLNYVILDHFGSEKIKSKHLSFLVGDIDKLILLSNKKINKPKFKLINHLYFKIGFIKKLTMKQKKKILLNKEIFLGDSDIFLNISKT